MELEHQKKNNILVVKPKEKKIDVRIASDFKSKMVELIDQGNENLVINLSDVDFIDSSGLGALVSVLKKLGNRGEVRMCKLKEDVRSLFKLTRLDKVFAIYHSEEEALGSFKK